MFRTGRPRRQQSSSRLPRPHPQRGCLLRAPNTTEKNPSGGRRRAAARAVNGLEATDPWPSRGLLAGNQTAVLVGYLIRTWFTAKGGHIPALGGLRLAAHGSATCARLACALNAALAGIFSQCGRHDASTEAVCRAQGYHLGSQPIVGRWSQKVPR